MPTFYLHIGMAKTATTSLQRSFDRSKQALEKNDMAWIGGRQRAHLFADALRSDHSPGANELNKRARRLLREFSADMKRLPNSNAVLSSEILFQLTGTQIAKLRHGIQSIVHPDTTIKVIVYLREPIGYVTSACQQAAKAGRITIYDIFDDPWAKPLSETIGDFRRVFGSENIIARLFSKDAFVNGNIHDDFLTAISIDPKTIDMKRLNHNQSLTSEGVVVATELQKIRPYSERHPPHRRRLYTALENIKGGKFVLPMDVQTRIIAESAQDVLQIREWFGIDIRPKTIYSDYTPKLSTDAAREIAQQIENEVYAKLQD